MSLDVNDRLALLVGRLCDGAIAESELSELNELLASSPDAVAEYLGITSIEFHLNRCRLPVEDQRSVVRLIEPSGESRAAPLHSSSRKRRLAQFAAMSAALLAVASLAVLLRSKDSHPYAARVASLVECEFGPGGSALAVGSQLPSGAEISLTQGLATLEFAQGAQAVIAGPARFCLDDANGGLLSLGRALATVPPAAKGFQVRMPSMNATDLGTQFGAYVHADGTSETHVFQGLVEVQRAPGAGKRWSLEADQALRIASDREDVEFIPVRASEFPDATHMIAGAAKQVSPSLPPLVDEDLALWLDASRSVQADAEDRVVSWGQDSTDRSYAMQLDREARPHWVADAGEGRPAVRFNGASFLNLSPLKTNGETTIVCVFQPSAQPPAGVHARILLHAGGVSGLTLAMSAQGRLEARAGGSAARAPQERQFAATPEQIGDDKPVVATLVNGRPQGRATLYLNGRFVGAFAAHAPLSGQLRMTIGAPSGTGDPFAGDLYELIVLKTALAGDESLTLARSLGDKYGVAVTEREPRVLSGLRPNDD